MDNMNTVDLDNLEENETYKIEKKTRNDELSKKKKLLALISLISVIVGGIFWFLYTITPEDNYINNKTFSELLNSVLKTIEMIVPVGAVCAIEASLLCYIILNTREIRYEKEKQKKIEM